MPETICKVCDYDAECIYDGKPMCYLCRENTAKAKREYADAEQAAHYSTPAPRWQHNRGPESCEDFYHACPCDTCKARERWLARQ